MEQLQKLDREITFSPSPNLSSLVTAREIETEIAIYIHWVMDVGL